MPARPAAEVDERTGFDESGVEGPRVGLEEGVAVEVGVLFEGQPGRVSVLPERGIDAGRHPPGGRRFGAAQEAVAGVAKTRADRGGSSTDRSLPPSTRASPRDHSSARTDPSDR